MKSTSVGIARYVGSYIKKQIMHRIPEDKGARLIRFINFKPGDRKASSRLAWNNDRAWLWRQKVGQWAREFGMHSMQEISDRCGPRWAYLFQEQILGTHLRNVIYPSLAAAHQAGDLVASHEGRKWNALAEMERSGRTVGTILLRKLEEASYVR